MAETIYGLTEDQVVKLRKIFAAFDQGKLSATANKKSLDAPVEAYLVETTEIIPAMAADVPGSGDALLWTVNDDGTEIVDQVEDAETIYNVSDVDIPNAAVVTVVREPMSGALIVTNGAPAPESTITVQGNGGAPSHAGQSTLRFNNEPATSTIAAVAFTVADAGGGIETIIGQMNAANGSSAGALTADTQTIAGAKTFTSTLTVGATDKAELGITSLVFTDSSANQLGRLFVQDITVATMYLQVHNILANLYTDLIVNLTGSAGSYKHQFWFGGDMQDGTMANTNTEIKVLTGDGATWSTGQHATINGVTYKAGIAVSGAGLTAVDGGTF